MGRLGSHGLEEEGRSPGIVDHAWRAAIQTRPCWCEGRQKVSESSQKQVGRALERVVGE